jgi:hypothetical protein
MLSPFNHAAAMRSMVAVIAGKCCGYGVSSKFITYEAVGFSEEILHLQKTNYSRKI